MKSFLSFFEQAEDTAGQEPKRVNDSIVTTFGRHNPPHAGHKLALDKAADVAGNENADQAFYTSRSQDKKKNPLPHELKVKHLQKMFPEHADKWDTDENVKTVLGSLTKAHEHGYKNAHLVVGGDRLQGMGDLARKYNGNLYDFENIYTHNAGDRDEGDDRIAQLSASKQRKAAQNGDFDGFLEGIDLHSGYSMDDAKELFELIQRFGAKNESMDYRSDIVELREHYAQGRLYKTGDLVESLANGLIGKVHRCGANHLIIVTEDDLMFKSFIHDVHLI